MTLTNQIPQDMMELGTYDVNRYYILADMAVIPTDDPLWKNIVPVKSEEFQSAVDRLPDEVISRIQVLRPKSAYE